MPEMNTPGPLPPLGSNKPEIPTVDPQLKPEVITRGMLTATEEKFLKQVGVPLSSNNEQVYLGGTEGIIFRVNEIYHPRMTVRGGQPALIFYIVPANGELPQVWTLRFTSQPGKEPFFHIQNPDQLRAVAKAVVSGDVPDLKRCFLEKAEFSYDFLEEYPIYNPTKVLDWPVELEKANQRIHQMEREKQALADDLEREKKRNALPTQTEPSGPGGPRLPLTAVIPAPNPGEPETKWWVVILPIAMILLIIVVMAWGIYRVVQNSH